VNPELLRIFESKRAYRRKLAALPIAEKLRMLELLRARLLEIAAARRKRPHEPKPD